MNQPELTFSGACTNPQVFATFYSPPSPSLFPATPLFTAGRSSNNAKKESGGSVKGQGLRKISGTARRRCSLSSSLFSLSLSSFLLHSLHPKSRGCARATKLVQSISNRGIGGVVPGLSTIPSLPKTIFETPNQLGR